MAEKRVSIRLGVIGGKEVEATFEALGTRGTNSVKKLGDQFERTSDVVNRGSSRMGGGLQNVGYQVQDFAVQVAGGTSATRALSQQLPQLLSGFGLFGVLAGTAAAVLVPLIGYLWGTAESAEAASKAVDVLAQDVNRLKQINEVYSTKGIEQLIEKYGVLDAKILTLIERQRQYALDKAMTDAHTAATSLEGGLEGIRALIAEIDNMEIDDPFHTATATIVVLNSNTEALADKFGLTVAQAQGLIAALDRAKSANSLGEMADATAEIAKYLEQSTLKGTEFAGKVIDAESALRALNNEAGGIQGWLGAAISGATDLAARMWDAAAGAAAIRDARLAADTPLARHNSMVAALEIGGRGRGVGVSSAPPTTHSADGTVIDITPPKPARGGGGGRGGGGARDATSDLQKMAAKYFDDTRTAAERYAAELTKLEAVKQAGAITDDTYRRALAALQEQYHQNENAVTGMTKKLEEFVAKTQDVGAGIGDALVNAFDAGADAVGNFVKTGKADVASLITDMLANFAKLSAQKYFFGPLADALSGGIKAGAEGGGAGGGGWLANVLAGLHHTGGVAGSPSFTRSVPVAAFAGARRMHGGGFAGLAPDEIPAILKRGERVLSPAETRGYGQGQTIVNFNVRDAESVRRSRSQLAADAARIIAAGRRGM